MSRPRNGRHRVVGLEFAWWRRLRSGRRDDQSDQAMTRTVLPQTGDRQPDDDNVQVAPPSARPYGALPDGDELRVRADLRWIQTRPPWAPNACLCQDREEVRDA